MSDHVHASVDLFQVSLLKTLFLLRHAKSSWDDASLDDHDRPLKLRGIKAAKRIGRLIRAEKLCPALVLCSTAVRARETWKLVQDEARFDAPIEYAKNLYHCAPDAFVSALHSLHWDLPSVMVIGHNPGLEEFLSHLVGEPQAMPTGALACIEVELPNWSEFSMSTRGRLIDLWRPRELKLSE